MQHCRWHACANRLLRLARVEAEDRDEVTLIKVRGGASGFYKERVALPLTAHTTEETLIADLLNARDFGVAQASPELVQKETSSSSRKGQEGPEKPLPWKLYIVGKEVGDTEK